MPKPTGSPDTGPMTETIYSSRRERTLWWFTLAAVAAIYSTLIVTPRELQANDVAAALFVAALLMAGAAVVAVAFETRPTGAQVGVLLGVAAVYLMVFQRIAIPADRTHLFEYSVVAVLIYQALRERARNGRRVPMPPVLAFAATTLIGVVDEGLQALIPDRVFDPIDIGFNTLAAFMAITALLTLGWVRDRSAG